MNAQEMFEAIGYRKRIGNGYIKFEVEECEVIEFDLEKKDNLGFRVFRSERIRHS